jgi:hypothetical protein
MGLEGGGSIDADKAYKYLDKLRDQGDAGEIQFDGDLFDVGEKTGDSIDVGASVVPMDPELPGMGPLLPAVDLTPPLEAVVVRDATQALDYDPKVSGSDALGASETATGPKRELFSDIDYQRFIQHNRRLMGMRISFLAYPDPRIDEVDRAQQIVEIVEGLPTELVDGRYVPPSGPDDQDHEFGDITEALLNNLSKTDFDKVKGSFYQEISQMINARRLPDINSGGRVAYSPLDLEFLSKWRDFSKAYPEAGIKIEGADEDWQKWVDEVKAQIPVDQPNAIPERQTQPTIGAEEKAALAQARLQDQLDELQKWQKKSPDQPQVPQPLSKEEISKMLREKKNGQYEILSQEPGFSEADWLDREYQRFLDSSLVKLIIDGRRSPDEELKTRLEGLFELPILKEITEKAMKTYLAEVSAAAGKPSPAATRSKELVGRWARYSQDIDQRIRQNAREPGDAVDVVQESARVEAVPGLEQELPVEVKKAREELGIDIKVSEDYLLSHPDELREFINQDQSYFKALIEMQYPETARGGLRYDSNIQDEYNNLIEFRLGEKLLKSGLPFADESIQRFLALFTKEEKVKIISRVQELMSREKEQNGS